LSNLNLDSLSDREREILNLAIDGMTDQQIANRLRITSSTVNSYWVRIRGKLGHLGRTELVSKIVQQSANVHSNSLSDRIRELEDQLKRAKSESANSTNAQLLHVALESNPEACVVFDQDEKFVLANLRFRELFDLPADDLILMSFDDLFKAGVRTPLGIALSQLRDRAKLGISFPLFGKKSRGALFRAFVLVGVGETEGKKLYTCVVRSFTEEVQSAQSRASLVVSEFA
jgi:DNA-binding CsgD family transcriptional regulator